VHVLELWRYPVKSLQGERVDAVELDERGVVGDRRWGIADVATGLVLTGRREPRLLHAAARLDGDDVAITLPDGATATSDAELSAWLGRPVALVRAGDGAARYEAPNDDEDEAGEWSSWTGPQGAFHDAAAFQVSLVGTATLRGWDRRRFRPNAVVDGDGDDALVGRRVHVGGAVLDVVKQVSRCVMVTRPQPGGIERDLEVLRTVHRERGGRLAVGGRVAVAGPMTVGDAIVDQGPVPGD
jgi:uncharacterized protein